MKALLKLSLASSALLAASAASALPVISISYDPDAAANFQAMLNGPTVVENFDGPLGGSGAYYDANLGVAGQNQTVAKHKSWEDKSASFTTAVGTFTLVDAGQTADDNVHNDQLMIESRTTGEDGRERLSTYTGDKWLDSNDAKEVVWTLGAPLTGNFNAFGFYLADPSDVSANLTITFDDGTTAVSDTTFYKLANANLGYVTVISDKNIVGATVTFFNTTLNDGWGIDDVIVGNVPEPGTLLLMGLGLLGLGAARRRIK